MVDIDITIRARRKESNWRRMAAPGLSYGVGMGSSENARMRG